MSLDPQLLHDTLDAIHEGLQILSPEWRYLYVNESVARQGRKPREALLGKRMQECYPGIEKTPMFAVLERCMRERRADTLENEFVYDDGRAAFFELRIQPCRAGLTILSLDIGARRNLEARLRDAHQQTLRELSTPVIRVHPGVLLLPLVGAIDARRAELVTETVLHRVEQDAARVLILDVAGVPVMDTSVADHLLQTTAAVRLLGADTVLTGVGATAAKTIVQLGLNLSSMHTTSHLAEGIELALGLVGKAILSKRGN